MRRILRTGICLFGLSAVFAACGQGEGGRCQVNSDCASGLTCLVANGNGICQNPITGITADAAADSSISEDSNGNAVDVGVDSESVSSTQIDAGQID